MHQRILTPRPPPKIVLKNVWQVERDKQSSSEQSCAEADFFKIDLRVQGVPLNAVPEDQGRVTKIQDLVYTLRTESVIADLTKTGEFNTFSEKSTKTKKWRRSNCFELGEVSEKIQSPSCAKYRPEGLQFCTSASCSRSSKERERKNKRTFLKSCQFPHTREKYIHEVQSKDDPKSRTITSKRTCQRDEDRIRFYCAQIPRRRTAQNFTNRHRMDQRTL